MWTMYLKIHYMCLHIAIPHSLTHAHTNSRADINECLDGNKHNCNHTCINTVTVGSYECGCPDGMRVAMDGINCEQGECMVDLYTHVSCYSIMPMTHAHNILYTIIICTKLIAFFHVEFVSHTCIDSLSLSLAPSHTHTPINSSSGIGMPLSHQQLCWSW